MTLGTAPGPDRCRSWLGFAGGSTSTSLVVQIVEPAMGEGGWKGCRGERKRKVREGKSMEREKELWVFSGFRASNPEFIPSLIFQNEILFFAYFKTHFQYLTNQTSEPIFKIKLPSQYLKLTNLNLKILTH